MRGDLIEHGIHADYSERWQRIDVPDGQRVALTTTRGRGASRRRAFLVAVGDHFIFARGRARMSLPGSRLTDALRFDSGGREALVGRLDFEISYGVRRTGAVPWEIRRSTLPFREGGSLLDPSPRPMRQGDRVWIDLLPGAGIRAGNWSVREWSRSFRW